MNPEIRKTLDDFVVATRDAFAGNLVAVILFGSAAEDRLRESSDVNVLVLLRAFERGDAARLGPALAFAGTAARLRAMFLLEGELEAAALAFPVKFADIRRRHQVLWGTDPFAGLSISRPAVLARLRQVLLNLSLRLRATLVAQGNSDDRLVQAITEASGPLRACAAEILELEGGSVPAPREALKIVAGKPLEELSQARENGSLPAGTAAIVLEELIALAAAMRARAERLS